MPEKEASAAWSLREEERRLNLLKDGGRSAMYGGDPYEDDLETVPAGAEAASGRSRGR